MLEFSKKTNQLMQSKYKYQLQEVEEPNLYREIFDYEAIPKIAFNNRLVPICVPDEIWMTDTTFRDGQQSVSPSILPRIGKRWKCVRIWGWNFPRSPRGFGPTKRTSSW